MILHSYHTSTIDRQKSTVYLLKLRGYLRYGGGMTSVTSHWRPCTNLGGKNQRCLPPYPATTQPAPNGGSMLVMFCLLSSACYLQTGMALELTPSDTENQPTIKRSEINLHTSETRRIGAILDQNENCDVQVSSKKQRATSRYAEAGQH